MPWMQLARFSLAKVTPFAGVFVLSVDVLAERAAGDVQPINEGSNSCRC
jgi:hypothetical protein